MTKSEYALSGCENYHSKFTFDNGTEEFGVMTTFFPDEPDNYYLVRSPKLIDFKKLMDDNNYQEMKKNCVRIDLGKMIRVERI
jgi:spore coat protein CotH